MHLFVTALKMHADKTMRIILHSSTNVYKLIIHGRSVYSINKIDTLIPYNARVRLSFKVY